MKRWLWPLLLLAACGDAPTPGPRNGAALPPFQTVTLASAPTQVPADYRGQVVALRFWADWCPYCRKEMAELQPVYLRLRERGLTILALNVAQDAATVRRFVEPLGISYPVLMDPEGVITRSYGFQTLPVTWLVDRRGVVRGKILGEASAETFERKVRELLDEP